MQHLSHPRNTWYFKGMKKNTSKSRKKAKPVKSSITLPPAELEIVNELMKKLEAKSKVEVIRRGLFLLRDKYEREHLQEEYRKASELVKTSSDSGLSNVLFDLSDLEDDGEDYSKW